MQSILNLILGLATVGIPLWFWFLDRRSFPRLKWISGGEPSPTWARFVVVLGLSLAVLIALSVPMGDFSSSH